MRKSMVKTTRLQAFLAATLLLGAGSGAALAQEQEPMAADTAQVQGMEQIHLMKADQLIGQSIQGGDNQELGQISDLMVDPVQGRVRYVVVSSEGEKHPVPWQAINFSHPEQTFKMDITADRLKEAPKGEQVADQQEAQKIFDFYGIAPYWQQGESGSQLPGYQQREESGLGSEQQEVR